MKNSNQETKFRRAGIDKVMHDGHTQPHEVTSVEGEPFPRVIRAIIQSLFSSALRIMLRHTNISRRKISAL